MFSSPPIWKEAPFIRLVIPFAAGIMLQSHFQLNENLILFSCILTVGIFASFSLYPNTQSFRFYWLPGVAINCLFLLAGAIFFNAEQSKNDWPLDEDFGRVIVKLEEPLVIKPKSLKAVASIQVGQKSNKLSYPDTNVILYFLNDSVTRSLGYGSRIMFEKQLQRVLNSGNPGAFDYQRYCAFQNIHHQVYLKSDEYSILPGLDKNAVKSFLFETRERVVNVIRQYIPGKKEAGLAEALLIGYKHDLDKELTQSYTNTGVAHIIAISGLHVGVIYLVLTSILNFFIGYKNMRWFRMLITIAGLWIFGSVAGGSPSVLRSAVMFTFIICGQGISRNISIYNSLAASAFVMLGYNPYWLWDVGFQLSYAAVLSIIIFMKPIYNLMFVENKLLDLVWKMNAVTLSAQILTIPLCLYYFNQFPTFFMITNLIAVPLSSIILFGELVLCMVSFTAVFAAKLGMLLSWLIRLMNMVVDRVERLPFSLISDIPFTIEQALLLYVFIVGSTLWLMRLYTTGLLISMLSILGFGTLRLNYHLEFKDQRKLIVYNVPSRQAIDLIEGNRHYFIGDSALLTDQFQVNFHLRPARIKSRATTTARFPEPIRKPWVFKIGTQKFALIDTAFEELPVRARQQVSAVIVSGNVNVRIASILEFFDCTQVVFDASNSLRRIARWKKECSDLDLVPFSVPEQGAFVMILN